MSTRLSPARAAVLAFAAGGLVAAASPAGAQLYPQPGYAADPYSVDGVIIRGARPQARSATTGAPIEWVSLSRPVSYRDLDLRTAQGADVLAARIRHAARDACRELDRRHPIAAEGGAPCYPVAVADAYDQMRGAMARAAGY